MLRNIFLCAFLGLCAPASAQVMSVGEVDGTVKDPTGAVLPNLQVTIASMATNQSRRATTNDIGYYFFPLVGPGAYRVMIEQPGFKRATQEVTVQTGRRATADFTLELGELSESVRVTAQASLLQTSTAAVARTIEQKQIQDLPLSGRNPLKLMLLTAGVTAAVTTNSNLLDVSGTSYLSTNGANRRLNEFLFDGIPNNISDRVNYIPPVDVVEEFTVQTNALDAEYGHGGGAYVNVASKAGTNVFHGQLYEFLRNDKFNANTWLNNKNNTAKTALRYNQFGVAGGGPVLIPRLLSGKDKLFWFFNYEGIRQRTPRPWLQTYPTDLERSGDFSRTLDRFGNRFEVYDPYSTRQNAQGQWFRDPFPNARIPESRWDPVSKNMLSFFPKPNQPGEAVTGLNNFYTVMPAKVDGDMYSARVDPAFGPHRVFARFSRNKQFDLAPAPYDIGGPEGTNRVQTSIGLSDTYMLSPSLIITAQGGMSRWTQEGVHPYYQLGKLGFPQSLLGQMQEQIFPRLSIGTFGAAIGASEGNWFEHTNTFSFNIGASKMSGRHNMKFGWQTQIKQNNSIPARYPSGTYSFTSGFTQGPDPNRVATNSGHGWASFLLGAAASGSLDIRAPTAPQAPFYGWYFQDDFKVTPKLTLNLGLRYEITLGTTERYNINVWGFDRVTPNPIEAEAKANYARSPIPELSVSDFRVVGGMVFTNPDMRRNGYTDKDNWGPRVGLAYRLFPRTILRAGFGIFYSAWWSPFVKKDGFETNTSMFTSADGGRTPADTLKNPFPQGVSMPTGATLGMKTLLGQQVETYDQFRKAIRNNRWNFGFQQELAKSFMFELQYVGAMAQDAPSSDEGSGSDERRYINYLPEKWLSLGSRLQDSVANPFYSLIPATSTLGRTTVARQQLLMLMPHFLTGTRVLRTSEGKNYYHSLQFTANKRMSHSFSAQGTYTWSKQLEKLRRIYPSDPEPSKMIGEFDNPHRATLALICDLPFGKGRPLGASAPPGISHLISGWEVSGVYIYMTGSATWLPAIVATGTSPKLSSQTLDNWFNRDSMKILPAFTARKNPWMWNDIRMGHQNNWDLAILKNTHFRGEKMNLQFRAELINAFNHPWWTHPDVNPASGTYGRVLNTANSPRDVQLAIKFIF